MTRYFHGGPAGRKLLDWIQPPDVTGAKSSQQVGPAALRDRVREVHRQDRVYVTPNRVAAIMFASGHLRPMVYEVEPFGDLEPDPDCADPSLSFTCLRARVIRAEPVSAEDQITCIRGMLASAPAATRGKTEARDEG